MRTGCAGCSGQALRTHGTNLTLKTCYALRAGYTCGALLSRYTLRTSCAGCSRQSLWPGNTRLALRPR